MSSRDAILARVRNRLGDADAQVAERGATARARIAEKAQHGPLPEIATLNGEARLSRFIEAATAVQTDVVRVRGMDAVPDALADVLRQRNLALSVRMGGDPSLAALDWGPIEVSVGTGRLDEPVTVSRAAAAAAETGTLALFSGPDNPVTLTFLGETHVVVLRAEDVAAGLEGVWDRIRSEGHDPRTVNFVTGPSRTGDIEQKIELGAHGPISLVVILVDPA